MKACNTRAMHVIGGFRANASMAGTTRLAST